MRLTKEEITLWFDSDRSKGCTHMIIVCDTFDYDYYPVYVPHGSDPKTVVAQYVRKSMQEVMEVYNLAEDRDQQIATPRNFNYGPLKEIKEDMKNNIENRDTFRERLTNHFDQKDIMLIDFAYDMSKEAHRPMVRDGGQRYFEHPRSGCLILMDELQLFDKDLLISFLLHDVGEDTALLGNSFISYETFVQTFLFRLSNVFGEKVADTTLRLTKPSVDNKRFVDKPNLFDYYISELKKSDEALLLKAVDRLHNLRSLLPNRPDKIGKQITETEAVYLPLFAELTGSLKPYMDILIEKINTQLGRLKG